MLTGIASVIFPSSNLDTDKAFWSSALGTAPNFDQPFYVGFNIDGRELGLDPDATGEGLPYPVTYWSTTDIKTAREALQADGATTHGEIRDLGGGMLLATMKDPSGNIFGLLQHSED
jgi:predicted enzyme related to lactoylglutathione lyase